MTATRVNPKHASENDVVITAKSGFSVNVKWRAMYGDVVIVFLAITNQNAISSSITYTINPFVTNLTRGALLTSDSMIGQVTAGSGNGGVKPLVNWAANTSHDLAIMGIMP